MAKSNSDMRSGDAKALKTFLRPENEQYLQHRARLRQIKSSISGGAVPPKLNVYKFLRIHKVENESSVLADIFHQNKAILLDIHSTQLNVKDESKKPAPIPLASSNLLNRQKLVESVEAHNRMLQQHIDEIANTPRMETQTEKKKPNTQHGTKHRTSKSTVPPEVLRKFNRLVKLPQNLCIQNRIFRPKVYFDLQAKGERSVGRIVVQLYTEAAPCMVLEFLRFCAAGDCRKIYFPRLYPMLWIEGEMRLSREYADPIDYDMKALMSTNEPGMLYFSLQDFKVFRQGLLPFSISFRPITINDGKHFAFGKIIKGSNNFLFLSEFGTKCGKPLKDIIVTSMGLIGA